MKRILLKGIIVLAILLLSMEGSANRVYASNDNSIVYYNFENNVNDSSGNNNNGSIGGTAAYVDGGHSGKALSLSGNGWINLPRSIIKNYSSFTVSMWFKTSTPGGLLGYESTSVGTTPGHYVPILAITKTGKLYAELYAGSFSLQVVSTNSVNDNQWHRVVMTWATNSIIAYLDGVSIGSASGTPNHLDMTYNQIGTCAAWSRPDYFPNNVGTWYPFTGLIDDFIMYSTAQSPADIAKSSQSITFDAIGNKIVGNSSFNLTAAASSGLPVTYTSSNTNVATVNGNTVTIKGAGTTNITASQDGNSQYSAAPQVVRTLSVADLSLSLSAVTGTYIGTQSITISCADAGAAIYYTVDGSIPTSGSTRYTSAINVASTETIKAIAVKAGYGESEVTAATYTIRNIAATPYTGVYDGSEHDMASISGILSEDTVAYSADGTDFSALCPSEMNAGHYIIYVKVTTSQGIWESGELTAQIGRAAGSITITGEPSKTYDGSPVSDPAVSKSGTGAVTYTYYSDNEGSIGTALPEAPSVIGTYWVRAVMEQDANYTAAEATRMFSIAGSEVSSYTITVQNEGNGTATANAGTSVSGAAITLSAEPADGFRFKEWQVVSGEISIVGNTFIMPESNVVIKAVFEAIPDIITYSVTVNNGFGGGSYEEGATVNITADSSAGGGQFIGWQVISGGALLSDSSAASTSFTMPGNAVEITAVYEDILPAAYTITVQNAGGGTAAANVASSVSGSAITLSAIPEDGYRFKEWQVVSGNISITGNTFIMPESDVILRAVFESIPVTIPVYVPDPVIPEPNEETVTVEVKAGETDEVATVITLKSTTGSDGTIALSATYDTDKAKETIENLNQKDIDTARIVIPDKDEDVTDTSVRLPADTLSLMALNDINLEIDTDHGNIYLPKEALQNAEDKSDEALYFRLIPVRNEEEKSQIIERAKQVPAVLNIVQLSSLSVIGTPVSIETNLPEEEVEITLPLKDSDLPETPQAREEFLKGLAVYIEHSDGEKELLKGNIVNTGSGVFGIRFTITKFSTFTILKSDSFIQKSKECEIEKIDIPEGTKDKEKELTFTVENKTKQLNLDLIVSEGAEWRLYSDSECTKEIQGSSLKLAVGVNTIFVKVTAEDTVTEKIYELTVIRKGKPAPGETGENISGTNSGAIPVKDNSEQEVPEEAGKADTVGKGSLTAGTEDIPKTGEASNAVLFACMAAVSGAGLMGFMRRKKEQRK